MAIENSVIFLPCRDIAATHDFYTRVVGLQKVQEQAGGTLHIYDTGYGYLGFCQYPDDRPVLGGPQGVCLSLNCADEADVDRFYARVTEQGPGCWRPRPCRSAFRCTPSSSRTPAATRWSSRRSCCPIRS